MRQFVRYEGNRVADVFGEKNRSEIDSQLLIEGFRGQPIRAIPAFMTADGFHYYLPAILAATLDATEELGELIDALIYYCMPLPSGGGMLHVERYSKKQRVALAVVFGHFRDALHFERAGLVFSDSV